ncbi:NADH-ubiquinone oxidoreductase (complex I) subunit 5 [Nitrosospira multiformis]|uniref:NADH-ubiquinone oxidoreductase (Complex I) subunit 5 n=1 Tax=Nitrosospira multiformis TaxID=1231 RepID=A0A2T5IDP5_9PROT|nr:proton-conducting transporter membrane subunit [Nitrosospira multiformis]PTQ81933.1 NADH-ubiquinone oxidoreductase (complex I) subunit 5 [Nitrosospira multiformis]
MTMPLLTSLLGLFIFIPLIGFALTMLVPKKNEDAISWIAYSTVGSHMVLAWIFLVLWLIGGYPTLETIELILYNTESYKFFISFYFDKITAVYLFVGSFLCFLVTVYSRWYLHRERGYKRFFNTILFFFIGYNIIIFSGNFETLFIGWEVLGITSFLLIGFYRERYLPVKNALKVFTVFRVADMGLILVIWMSHHLWHENITFSKLMHPELVAQTLEGNTTLGILIGLMLLLAAAVKSGQLPFSSWVPRAMEGPTPSSAIFYGSLSVHLGVFLLLRTFPFWENQLVVVAPVILLGVATAVVATLISRVQSSIKTQIAYSSVAQIGIIFVEVALGFYDLALIHLAGNAFLRTYQLLVSPSAVTFLLRDQFYNFVPREYIDKHSTSKQIEYAAYMLSVKEFNLDSFMYFFFWDPVKWIGRKLNLVLSGTGGFIIATTLFLVGLACLYYEQSLPVGVQQFLPTLFAFIALIVVLKSFSERMSPQLSWYFVIMNHLWIALAISFYDEVTTREIVIYISGILLSGLVGYACLAQLKSLERKVDLKEPQGQGHVYEYPSQAFIFLLACLGLMGFPITPSFLGIDLIFTHIHTDQIVFAFILALSFIIVGLSLVRIYSRVYLGPHVKTYHAVPFKNS